MLAETCIDLSPPSWGPVINQKKGEEGGGGGLGLCKKGKRDDNFAGKRGTLATKTLCTHIEALSYEDDLFNNRKVNLEE